MTPRSPGHPARERLTDAGAAERFVRLHGDAVRFDHRRGHWLVLRSHRWVVDADEAVMRLALDFARAWQREALDIPERERRDDEVKFGLRLERRDALRNVLGLARAMRPVAETGGSWDRDPWLLGTSNGVVDLRDATLRPGRPSDAITMATGVPFDADARCPRFEEFLAEVFDGRPELTQFVARAVGYTLTGLTTEQALFIAHGQGANGKSTLLNVLRHVLGDYALNTPFSTFELHQRASIPNDVAALVNRRLVMASETTDGARLNEGRIKALTGGDSVTARFLHGEFFTFDPVAKFWLSVNHKPVVRDDSHGFWRRLRLIPFTRTFAVNPRLADELRAEAPGILAWAVRGCLAWQREGLNPPPVVVDATREYERESDQLATFVDEACDRDARAETRAADLYRHYAQWATGAGLTERERLTMQAFGRKVGERFRSERTRAGKVYFGVAGRAL